MAAADFDGDGDPDLVAATRSGGMRALANQAGGWDITDISNPGGFEHQDLTTGDFDGNGRPDVAVAIEGDDEVGILLNESPADADPDTVKYSMSTVPVQNVPRDVAAGDWDEDGDLDLVASNSQDPDPVSVLTNDGTGSFTETDTLSAGASPWGIAGGELDEEPGLDFAVANRNGGDVSFFLNDGTGTFGRFGTDQEVGSLPEGLATGLLNGDGVADVIVANATDDDVSVLTSTDPLPVELGSFEAITTEDGVRLTWQTASETNNSGFDVQRREGKPSQAKDSSWTTVGFVEGAGTTSEPQSYQFTDEDLLYDAGGLTYRLKQIDNDMTTTLSDPVTIERQVSKAQLLGTFPNPASQQATARFALPDRQEIEIRLYDALGRQVRTIVDAQKEGRHEETIDLSGLSSGTYFLRLEAGSATKGQQVTVVR